MPAIFTTEKSASVTASGSLCLAAVTALGSVGGVGEVRGVKASAEWRRPHRGPPDRYILQVEGWLVHIQVPVIGPPFRHRPFDILQQQEGADQTE